jgi:UDPglucose--hexose-1-phosphate uridylyltransferase
VSKIEFAKKEDQVWLLDPKDGFTKKRISFEVRKDPLTGHVSRILPHRRRQLETEIPREMIEASRKGCPFCPDQVVSSTPKFIPEIVPEGRIQKGRAVLFPNAFPYARYNSVIVFSGDHFLHLDQFTVDTIKDGFLAAREGILRIEKREPENEYASINWNYLPQAGGGLYHPHLQIIVQDTPTATHEAVLAGLEQYQKEKNSFFWEDLLREEKRRAERYIGSCGDIHFMAAFSPLGVLGEVIILFSGRSGIAEISDKDWTDFSSGLIKLFGYLSKMRIFSFNLSLFSGHREGSMFWVYGRVCPRMIIPPWNTSDINYLEKLHGEVICVISPEDLYKDIAPFFS